MNGMPKIQAKTSSETISVMRYVSVDSHMYESKFAIKITKDKTGICENMHIVNLDDMNLEFIKSDIVKCDTIQEISMENNNLKSMPSHILNNVPRLACLNLRRNKINLYNVDSVSMKHDYLRVLNLSNQGKFSNEFAIHHSRELEDATEEVDDIYNNIVFNSSGMSLPRLEHLDLSKNDISTLSWDFNTTFPRLTHLYLSNIYADSVEPSLFQKIPASLRYLYLENNQFRNLTLRNLVDVRAIYLDGNTKLKNIEISSSGLQVLSLSNCLELQYIELNTPYLQELDLTKNNLHTMSAFHFENYQALQILLLDGNRLLEIPILKMQRLVELSLNYNMIRHVPSNSLLYLISLKKLSLRGNNIEGIHSDAFLGLRKLEYLDLSANRLRTLPSNWILPMMALQCLNLASNQFASISDIPIAYSLDSHNYLKHLLVKDNKFFSISTLHLAHLPPDINVHMA